MKFEMNTIQNIDCIEAMKEIPDQFFDLAIVDPPFGIKIVSQFKRTINQKKSMMRGSNGIVGGEWDDAIPGREYFEELERVSKNRIIWGGNYFLDHLGSTRCLIVWDKMNGGNPLADAEIAWTSFEKSVRIFRLHHFSKGYESSGPGKKIHPTQKPVKLYKWILSNFAKEGDRILDTHGGSGSLAIASHDLGHEFLIFEIDPEHCQNARKRLEDHRSQMNIFEFIE